MTLYHFSRYPAIDEVRELPRLSRRSGTRPSATIPVLELQVDSLDPLPLSHLPLSRVYCPSGFLTLSCMKSLVQFFGPSATAKTGID